MKKDLGTVKSCLYIEFFLANPCDFFAIVVISSKDGEVIYDGQLHPLLTDREFSEILSMNVMKCSSVGYPFPSLISITV